MSAPAMANDSSPHLRLKNPRITNAAASNKTIVLAPPWIKGTGIRCAAQASTGAASAGRKMSRLVCRACAAGAS